MTPQTSFTDVAAAAHEYAVRPSEESAEAVRNLCAAHGLDYFKVLRKIQARNQNLLGGLPVDEELARREIAAAFARVAWRVDG